MPVCAFSIKLTAVTNCQFTVFILMDLLFPVVFVHISHHLFGTMDINLINTAVHIWVCYQCILKFLCFLSSLSVAVCVRHTVAYGRPFCMDYIIQFTLVCNFGLLHHLWTFICVTTTA